MSGPCRLTLDPQRPLKETLSNECGLANNEREMFPRHSQPLRSSQRNRNVPMDQAWAPSNGSAFKSTAAQTSGDGCITAAGTSTRDPLKGDGFENSKEQQLSVVGLRNDESDVRESGRLGHDGDGAGSVSHWCADSPEAHRLRNPISSRDVSNRCYRLSRTMTRVTYKIWSEMKLGWENARALARRSGAPTVGRIGPSWRRLKGQLPCSPMTFGWVTTREPLVCLLGKWKFEVGRAWETSWVVPTSVRA